MPVVHFLFRDSPYYIHHDFSGAVYCALIQIEQFFYMGKCLSIYNKTFYNKKKTPAMPGVKYKIFIWIEIPFFMALLLTKHAVIILIFKLLLLLFNNVFTKRQSMTFILLHQRYEHGNFVIKLWNDGWTKLLCCFHTHTHTHTILFYLLFTNKLIPAFRNILLLFLNINAWKIVML